MTALIRQSFVLRRWQVGGQVLAAQKHLVRLGFLSKSDWNTGRGVFGPRTEAAVKSLQVNLGIPVTGRVCAQTWDALINLRQLL